LDHDGLEGRADLELEDKVKKRRSSKRRGEGGEEMDVPKSEEKGEPRREVKSAVPRW
jgi:hypothetical protein